MRTIAISERVRLKRAQARQFARISGRPPQLLHRTWCFRLAMLAFVALSTKHIEVAMHGLAGMFVILALAALAGFVEDSFTSILPNVRRNAMRNQIMVLLAIWYAIGVFGKMYLTGAPYTDWRGVMGPVLLVFALLTGFGFMHEARCARSFQIVLILMVGLQSAFAGRVMLDDTSFSRDAVTETGGAWVYGDQAGFTTQAMLLPILVWRAFAEKGALRLLLITGCAGIAFAVVTCQFTTALMLFLLSIPTAGLLGLSVVKHSKGYSRVLLVGVALLLLGLGVLQLLPEVSLWRGSAEKVARVLQDPTSGGYETEGHITETSRWFQAKRSFDTFLEHPIFGGGSGPYQNSKVVGGHSSLFDLLGFYGLLGGGGAFIALVLLLLARAFSRLHRQRNWAAVAVASSMISFLIAGEVNPYWEGAIVMVFLVARLFRMEGERT